MEFPGLGIRPEQIDRGIRFFLYVLVFWLPYSPAVVEVCVIVSLILWILKRAMIQSVNLRGKGLSFQRKWTEYLKGFQVVPSGLNRPIGFFLFVCMFSVIGSRFLENAAHNFFTKTLEWFVVYFLVIEVFQKNKQIMVFVAIWFFTTISTVFDSFIQYYFTYKDIFLGHVIEPGARATAGFKTPNGLGAYLSLFIPFLFSLIFLHVNRVRWRLLLMLAFALSFLAVLNAFSRGAVLGIGFGILFFVCFLFLNDVKKKRQFGLLLFIMVVLLSIYGLWMVKGSGGAKLWAESVTAQWRLTIWEDSLRMIHDKPIFGHGINSFMRTFQEYRRDVVMSPTYAHNCYIQLAAETGLMGLMAFLWIIGSIFYHFFRGRLEILAENKNVMILLVGLLSGIISFLIHSFFDNHFYSLQLSVYFWSIVGVFVALKRNVQKASGLEKESLRERL